MSFTPLIKPLVRLSVLGVSSSVATGIGAGRFVEKAYPTGDAKLLKIGFKRNTPNPDLGADVSTGTHSPGEMIFKFQSYGCFQNFFPGANMNHKMVSGVSEPSTQDLVIDASSFKKPIGCALLNLAFSNRTVEKTTGDQKENVKVDNYIFKSEITVKNDKFGGSLGTGMKKLFDNEKSTHATGDNMQFVYYLIFLEKKSNDKSGEIKGGYSGHDAAFSSIEAPIHLVIPTKEDGYELIKNAHEPSSRNYSGVGEVSEGGNEVFSDIEVWRGNNDEKDISVELLGKQSFETTKNTAFGYEDVDVIYVPNKGGLKISSNKKNIKASLKKMYEPFRNQKGRGIKAHDYCDSQSFKRSFSEEDLYKIQNFCYKK